MTKYDRELEYYPGKKYSHKLTWWDFRYFIGTVILGALFLLLH